MALKHSLFFLLGISFALCLTAAAQTQTSPSEAPPATQPQTVTSALPARLSDVEGTVRIAQMPASTNSAANANEAMPPAPPVDMLFRDALVNMPVMAGMEVQTGADGRAEIQFSDGSLARVAPNSDLTVSALGSDAERVQSGSGLTYYELPSGGQAGLTIAAGPDIVAPQPGSLLRIDLDQTPYRVAVLRGAAQINSAATDISFEVAAQETATLDPTSASSYDVKDEVASNSWDTWNDDRDTALNEMAAGQTNARAGSPSQDAEAWDDLDYYGTWYNVPGAGMAWGPDGVDTSFDPYGAGAWGYYPSVGYTWISAYPWGWLPYRCGDWNYFGSFGWLWQPGGACGLYGGSGWYPYTGIRHAPPGYRLPLRPFDRAVRSRLHGAPLPRPEPLHIVRRGPAFQFRHVGDTRPDPRAFPLRAENGGDSAPGVAPTLPFVNHQQYGAVPGAPASGFVDGNGVRNEHVERGRTGYIPSQRVYTPPARGFPAAPRSFPSAPRSYPAAPRSFPSAPRSFPSAPRAMPMPRAMPAPAPHVAAPAGHTH